MSKTILVIDTSKLNLKIQQNIEDPGNLIRGIADREFDLQANGKWRIRHCDGAQNNGLGPVLNYIDMGNDCDFIDVVQELAMVLGIDLNDPAVPGPICMCPTECDCQDYDAGLVSNECPIHNDDPQPSPFCPQHGINFAK